MKALSSTPGNGFAELIDSVWSDQSRLTHGDHVWEAGVPARCP